MSASLYVQEETVSRNRFRQYYICRINHPERRKYLK